MWLRWRGPLRRFGMAALACLLFGCARVQTPLHPVGPEGSFYVVGIESLADIAKRQGIPLEDLAEINGLPADAPLEPGQVIFVLAPPPPPGALEPPLPPESETAGPGRWPPCAGRCATRACRRTMVSAGGRNTRASIWLRQVGTPVLAAKDGVVLYAGNTVKGYGNMVVLSHDGDLLTAYAHASVLLVQKGDRVRAGQPIARVGQTGHATAPHLHFEVRRGRSRATLCISCRRRIDPRRRARRSIAEGGAPDQRNDIDQDAMVFDPLYLGKGNDAIRPSTQDGNGPFCCPLTFTAATLPAPVTREPRDRPPPDRGCGGVRP